MSNNVTKERKNTQRNNIKYAFIVFFALFAALHVPFYLAGLTGGNAMSYMLLFALFDICFPIAVFVTLFFRFLKTIKTVKRKKVILFRIAGLFCLLLLSIPHFVQTPSQSFVNGLSQSFQNRVEVDQAQSWLISLVESRRESGDIYEQEWPQVLKTISPSRVYLSRDNDLVVITDYNGRVGYWGFLVCHEPSQTSDNISNEFVDDGDGASTLKMFSPGAFAFFVDPELRRVACPR